MNQHRLRRDGEATKRIKQLSEDKLTAIAENSSIFQLYYEVHDTIFQIPYPFLPEELSLSLRKTLGDYSVATNLDEISQYFPVIPASGESTLINLWESVKKNGDLVTLAQDMDNGSVVLISYKNLQIGLDIKYDPPTLLDAGVLHMDRLFQAIVFVSKLLISQELYPVAEKLMIKYQHSFHGANVLSVGMPDQKFVKRFKEEDINIEVNVTETEYLMDECLEWLYINTSVQPIASHFEHPFINSYLDDLFNIGCDYEEWTNYSGYHFFKLGAELGDHKAQCNLGILFEHSESQDKYSDSGPISRKYQAMEAGKGPLLDLNLAAKWYKASAQIGYSPAQYNLARIYENSQYEKHDYGEAERWYLSAAKQGDADAMYQLGVLYENKDYAQYNLTNSCFWYQKAAEDGHIAAQYNLGLLFYEGMLGSPDYALAAKWLKVAASRGDTDAISFLEENEFPNKGE